MTQPAAGPEALRETLGRLEAAGSRLRERPPGEIAEALGAVLDTWADPSSVWRQRLAAEHPAASGFSPAVVSEGLARGLAGWTAESLCSLVDQELGGPEALGMTHASRVMPHATTSAILAGAIPMPSLLALVAPLAVGSPVLAKVASRDPLTPRLVAESIRTLDPALGACVEVARIPGHDADSIAPLLAAECCVVTGSDETVAQLRERAPATTTLVAHGHKFSIGIVGEEALRDPERLAGVAERLALDTALWDQLGCLSPWVIYGVGPNPADGDRLAEALAQAMSETEERLPRGRVEADALAAIAHEAASAELRGAAGQRVMLLADPGQRWTVVREPDPTPRPAPLHRFLRVVHVPDPAALLDALAPLGRHLAGVALEGFPDDGPLTRQLLGLGASRICRAGDLQTPPLSWPRDGLPVLRSLVREHSPA